MVSIGDFINIFRVVSYKKNDAHNEKQKNDCFIIRGENIDEGRIPNSLLIEISAPSTSIILFTNAKTKYFFRG